MYMYVFSENAFKLSLWTHSFLLGEKEAETHVLRLSPRVAVPPALLLHWPFGWDFPTYKFSLVFPSSPPTSSFRGKSVAQLSMPPSGGV